LQITPIENDKTLEVKPILEVSQPLTSQTKQETEAAQ
jgi:hypothetical protein